MQASGCMELMFCDQSFFKLQLAFPTSMRVSVPRPLGLAIGPAVGDFFFDNIFEITLYLLPCLSCVACFNFNQSSISWSLVVCTRIGHVHFVPSLCFNLALLILHIYSCNHLLNAQYLAVCNLCQAWISNELYLDYKFVFVVTCCMHNCWLCAHCAKPGIQSSFT
jgi:hypothetical protein